MWGGPVHVLKVETHKMQLNTQLPPPTQQWLLLGGLNPHPPHPTSGLTPKGCTPQHGTGLPSLKPVQRW